MTDFRSEPRTAEPEVPPALLGTIEHVLADRAIEGELSSFAFGSALGPYRKLLFQLAAPLSALLLASLAGPLSLVQILTAVVGVLTAFVIYPIANAEEGPWRYAKAIAAFASAGVQALVVLLVGGVALDALTPDQWVGVITQALAAIGVLVAPNDPEPVEDEQVDAGDPPALPAASR